MTLRPLSRLRRLLAHDVLRFAILIAIAVFLLDWATKSWALEALDHTTARKGMLMGVERNAAFAFSTGEGRLPGGLVIGLRMVALAGVVVLSRRVGARNRRLASGFALLIAGGSGNAADVLFRGGAVVDFIHAGPVTIEVAGELVQAGLVFNAADVAIVVALGLLAPLIREWSLAGQRRLAHWESRYLHGRSETH